MGADGGGVRDTGCLTCNIREGHVEQDCPRGREADGGSGGDKPDVSVSNLAGQDSPIQAQAEIDVGEITDLQTEVIVLAESVESSVRTAPVTNGTDAAPVNNVNQNGKNVKHGAGQP